MHVPESCRFGRLRALAGLAVTASVTLSGCASLSGHQVAATNEGQVEISEIVKTGPVVVFEAGLAGHKEVWNKVFPEIAKTNTVFAYNRPGVGRSTATTRPRDAATMVEDLRALLRKQDLPPPYILVGHSAGGLYLQLFASLPGRGGRTRAGRSHSSHAVRGGGLDAEPLDAVERGPGRGAHQVRQGGISGTE